MFKRRRTFRTMCLKYLFFVSVVAGRMTSIHSAYNEEVHNVPMEVIIRPFIPELDENKVQSLMATIQVSSLYYRHSDLH